MLAVVCYMLMYSKWTFWQLISVRQAAEASINQAIELKSLLNAPCIQYVYSVYLQYQR